MNCLRCRGSLTDESEVMVRYGLHLSCFALWFGLKKEALTAIFTRVERLPSDSSDSNLNSKSPNNSYFSGKFKKYSAELNGETYLFKMRQDGIAELPEVEYLCNQIGQQLSVGVASFYLIELDGEKTFVTKIFIASGKADDLQHIHHFRPDNQHNCEMLIKIVAEKTNSPFFVQKLIKTILFDALIGNGDRHGRNLALIDTGVGYELSPAYDNVSNVGLESSSFMFKVDFNPTGRISTQATDAPNMFDYAHELIRLGYK